MMSSGLKNSTIPTLILMQIKRKHFPDLIPDNEEVFLSHLTGVLEAVDELACLQITKMPSAYQFRIAPSVPKYSNPLLKELLKFHNLYGIQLNLSKSIKASGTLAFEINLS